MLFYEVKLINPQTKEIYYHKVGKKPELPCEALLRNFQGAMIVINTTTSLLNHIDPPKR